MRVLIAGQFAFPTGSAAAARVRNLSKGLSAIGAKVHLVPIFPNAKSPEPNGIIRYDENISYEHILRPCSGTPMAFRIRWLFQYFLSGLSLRRRFAKSIRSKKYDFFVGYGEGAAQLMPMFRLCKQNQVVSLWDVVELSTEYPIKGAKLNPVFWDRWLAENMHPRLVSGLTIIADGLRERYQHRCDRILKLPAMEEWSEPNTYSPRPDGAEIRLTYVGNLLGRDAPEFLLSIVRHMHALGCDFQLDCIGRFDSNPYGRQVADRIREDPSLLERINLRGEVTDAELTRSLSETDGIIHSRRNAVTEVCSFPTRLAEGLKTARPVFVSDVGDIGQYFVDGQDAVLLPSDPLIAAKKIVAAFKDRKKLVETGQRGFERGRECFNCVSHAKRVLEFVQRIQGTEP